MLLTSPARRAWYVRIFDLPSNCRLNEHRIYIRHCQESNSQSVPSQAGADPPRPHWQTSSVFYVYITLSNACVESASTLAFISPYSNKGSSSAAPENTFKTLLFLLTLLRRNQFTSLFDDHSKHSSHIQSKILPVINCNIFFSHINSRNHHIFQIFSQFPNSLYSFICSCPSPTSFRSVSA